MVDDIAMPITVGKKDYRIRLFTNRAARTETLESTAIVQTLTESWMLDRQCKEESAKTQGEPVVQNSD